MGPAKEPLLALSVKEFCGAVGISTRTFYALKAAGKAPPVVRIGRRTVIRVKAAEQWLQNRERKAA